MEIFYDLIGRNADPIAWWQMCIRAIIIFLYAVAIYRLLPRRAFTRTSAIDMIVLVLMGSSLSRALTGNAPLLATLAATATFAGLYVLMAFAAQRSELLSHLFKGRPIIIIRDGKVDRRATRRALLGPRDVEEEMRLHDLAGPEEVAEARLERNGSISFCTRRGKA